MSRNKLIVAVAAVMLLATAAVAYAANSYEVGGKVTPTKSGTKSRPATVKVDLSYKVSDPAGPNVRPAALDAQRIFFEGIRINTIGPKCTASQINQGNNPSDADCPRAARIATGFANNLAGPIADRNGPNARCYLDLRLYNSGGGKLALFVAGGPSENEAKNCPLDVSRAIPVNVRNGSRGATISLSIPNDLKVPAPGVRNALYELNLKGIRKSARRNGRSVGIFQSFACSGRDRDIRYTFDNEEGPNVTETAKVRCS